MMGSIEGRNSLEKSFIRKLKQRDRSNPRFRSQSAMEYLMTYGWAILIISIVMAALFSLGVFSAMNLAPKAQPGSCYVFRPNGPGTTSFISTEGLCNGALPEYVASFSQASVCVNNGYVPIRVNSITQTTASALTMTWWIYNNSNIHVELHLYSQNVAPGGSGFYCGGQCDIPDTVVYSPAVPSGWVFYSLVLASNGSAVLYANGNHGSAVTWNGPLVGIGDLNLLGYEPTCSDWSATSMANVQLYNTSLSASEIQALYLEGIGGAPIDLQNLVAWYPLNGNANDYSGNRNNGVPTNVIFTSTWESGYTPP